MRVIAGTARSMPLKTPVGMDTRPTQDRIKETLFNILQADIPYCVFVDLFAGSGAIGIEALSRGASKAYFIDNANTPVECIKANLEFTKLGDRAIVIKQDAAGGLLSIFEKHADIIFMDPPYRMGLERGVLTQLRTSHFCDEETIIIIESDLNDDFSWVSELGYEITREKCYKTNKHVFLRKTAAQ